MTLRARCVFLLFALSALPACGGSTEPPPKTPAKAPEPASAKSERPPPGTLWREDVDRTVDAGLGRFLQRVEVEAALDNGQFVGFRIVHLEPPAFWKGVDLAPGDIVTSVNGMPIERETQAYDAFMALKKAPKLRVSYIRGGAERSLVFSIVPKKKR